MKHCISSAFFLNALLGRTLASSSSTPFVQTFDNITTIPDVARLSPVGIQDGISFVNFDVGDPDLLIETIGVISKSKPNFAVLARPAGNLTVAYPGSTVKSFTISSFYYACDISGQGAANDAPSCSFTLTGFKALSNPPVGSQSFAFVPSKPVDAMQIMYELTLNSGFQQPLKTVVFTTTSLLAATGLVSLVMDNIDGKLLCFYALRIMYHLALTILPDCKKGPIKISEFHDHRTDNGALQRAKIPVPMSLVVGLILSNFTVG